MPSGVVELHAPPPIPEKLGGGAGQLLMLLPMLSGVGSMGFMFAGSGTKGTNIASSAMFAMSSIGMGAASLGRLGGDRKKRLGAERRDYMRHLSQVRRRSRTAAYEQAEALEWLHPQPQGLQSLARTSRLWERRPFDADFATVRLGIGEQELALNLHLPDTAPVEDVEVLSAVALRRFLDAHGTVPDLPVALALRSFARVRVEGADGAARAMVRALLAQVLTWHAPTELRIALCVDQSAAQEWDWLKWVPHALHTTRSDAAGPLRLVGRDLAEVEDLLGDELAGRPWFSRTEDPLTDRAHVVVLIDGGRLSGDGQLSTAALQGVTVLDLSSTFPEQPEVTALHLRVTPDAVLGVDTDRLGQEVLTNFARPDGLSREEVTELARAVAPIRMPVEGDSDQPLTLATGLTELLGVSDPRTLDPAQSWKPRQPRDRLRVGIGVGADGQPVELDIKEAAQGGMGPHGLVVGATGSGKSELLRTLVLGLGITHSSETLNFILVDFKGGATFTRLDRLPHTSAVITNLAEELSLVDRMQDAISGELNRRMELLRDAGNFASLRDYDAARAGGAALAPLPTLFVVVDEFSELLAAKPDFIDLFVMIGRVGRSLGVHLLLASQRLEEGKLRGLDTYLSYRIGLKTFSAAESRIVLGVPDAYELPTAPGNGYLKYDVASMTRFKAAYVSGPYRAAQSPAESVAALPTTRPVRFGLDPVEVDGGEADQSGQDPAAGKVPSMLDIVVERLEKHGPPAHEVWLPPLAEPAPLDALLPDLLEDPRRGLTTTDIRLQGRLRAAVGVVDRPYEQKRDQLWLDFSGAAGHAAVVGAPQSGKSTAVRSIVAGLALTHTPDEIAFYCLDFGGGSLGGLAGLPHVGAVAGRLQPDMVRRTVSMVARLLDRREESFAAAGISSISQWREQVRTGAAAVDGYGDVFLVVDGWAVLKESFEDLEPLITSVAARGLNFGIHVIVTSTRWAEVRAALRDLLGTRIELRLGDPIDSEVASKVAALVPVGQPGRGINTDRFQLLMAAPRIDGVPSVENLSEGVAGMVHSIAGAWPGRPVPPIRLLPLTVQDSELPDRAAPGIPLAIDEDYEPVSWDPDTDQHLLVFGDAEAGKTTVLRSIVQKVMAARTPEQAQFVLVDPRRGLLEHIPNEYLAARAVNGADAGAMIAQAAAAVTKRLPGVDVTPAQLRDRSWWHGPEMFVVIDDFDMVSAFSPIEALLPLLSQARDIGLHVIATRASRGAGRAAYEPLFQRLREAGTPALVMSTPPEEGTFYGTGRPMLLPAGRARWVTRRGSEFLVQVAVPRLSPSGDAMSTAQVPS